MIQAAILLTSPECGLVVVAAGMTNRSTAIADERPAETRKHSVVTRKNVEDASFPVLRYVEAVAVARSENTRSIEGWNGLPVRCFRSLGEARDQLTIRDICVSYGNPNLDRSIPVRCSGRRHCHREEVGKS